MDRSENMRRIKASGSKAEVYLRKAVWNLGLRYRKNYRAVTGVPDLCFIGCRAAVFCDSEFWHGKKLLEGEVPVTNSSFWIDKLQGNIKRDREVNKKLCDEGWLVLRFWNTDLLRNSSSCADALDLRLGAWSSEGKPSGLIERFHLATNSWRSDVC